MKLEKKDYGWCNGVGQFDGRVGRFLIAEDGTVAVAPSFGLGVEQAFHGVERTFVNVRDDAAAAVGQGVDVRAAAAAAVVVVRRIDEQRRRVRVERAVPRCRFGRQRRRRLGQIRARRRAAALPDAIKSESY